VSRHKDTPFPNRTPVHDTTSPFPEPGEYWEGAMGETKLARWRKHLFFKRIIWRITFGGAETIKRLLDIIISAGALVASTPIFIIFSILIKLEDRGPVFFKQPRVGKGGKIFHIWKFRSMIINAEKLRQELDKHNVHKQSQITFKMKDDPRITKIGKFIRKYSVDEIPQFINVLLGDMSLVGPRPPILSEVTAYKASQLRRLQVKPGITCLWQIQGRGNIDFEGQVRLDLQYISSQTIWTDIKILIKTIPAVLFGRGSY